MFQGCNNPLAFQQHEENSSMSIIVVEADPELNRYHMRPVLIVSVLVPVCQHALAVTSREAKRQQRNCEPIQMAGSVTQCID